MVHGSVKIENVIKVGEYWCVVSIMLSCVICVCLKCVECHGDSVWVSQVVECCFTYGVGSYLWAR